MGIPNLTEEAFIEHAWTGVTYLIKCDLSNRGPDLPGGGGGDAQKYFKNFFSKAPQTWGIKQTNIPQTSRGYPVNTLQISPTRRDYPINMLWTSSQHTADNPTRHSTPKFVADTLQEKNVADTPKHAVGILQTQCEYPPNTLRVPSEHLYPQTSRGYPVNTPRAPFQRKVVLPNSLRQPPLLKKKRCCTPQTRCGYPLNNQWIAEELLLSTSTMKAWTVYYLFGLIL